MPTTNSLRAPQRSLAGLPSLLALLAACNPAAGSKPPVEVDDTPSAHASSELPRSPERSAAPELAGGGLADSSAAPAAAALNAAPSCSSTRVQPETIHQPIDLIVVLDNSPSMGDEARAVETNLNVNLAQALESSGIDYRLILISQHRTSDNLGQRTSACISRPLSGLGQCPADAPVFGERFFQYSMEIGSHNSLDLLLESYDGSRPDEFDLAPGGWSQWLRSDANKVFLEISDDDARSSAESFASQLTALAPDQFGDSATEPRFVWHSIIGLAEKADPTAAYLPGDAVETSRCEGAVASSGDTYQELSRLSGGLRFPICEFEGYDRVFQTIAQDVAISSRTACAFPIPEPPTGQELELDKVAVSYTPGDGSGALTLGQVTERSKCGSDAFLIQDGAIQLCSEACARVNRDALASLDVVFSCTSTLILR